jgi:hypothetical protein
MQQATLTSITALSASAPAGDWEAILTIIAAADAAAEEFDDRGEIDGALCACDRGRLARTQMWRITPPTLQGLAWKLEAAIVYAGLDDEPDHPLNWVLSDLRKLASS